jgi:cytoskeletal protein RodZ
MEAWQSVGDSRNRHAGWSSSLSALLLVVVVMLVCSGIYAFWQRPRRAGAAANQTATAPPPAARPQSSAETAAPPPSAPATPVAPESQPPQPAGEPPAASAPPPAIGATAALGKPDVTGAPALETPAAPPGPVHVEVTATEPVWVRAVSDGKYQFSGTLEANQTRTVDANESVLLRLGNAGSVNIVLNGKPIGAVGPRGQVRNVQLTPGGFQIVAAPKSPAPLDPL